MLTTATCHIPTNFIFVQDVGCGGGILSERLARLGADVTGIDPVQVIYIGLF